MGSVRTLKVMVRDRVLNVVKDMIRVRALKEVRAMMCVRLRVRV